MKKRLVKILSAVLAVIMSVSLLPIAAFAEAAEPETGSVAIMVYSPEFTALIDSGNLDTLKDAVNNKIIDQDAIPEINVTLKSLENNNSYKLEKKPESVLNSTNYTSDNESIEKIMNFFNGANGLLGFLGLDALSKFAGDLYTTYRVDNVPVGTYTLNVDKLNRSGCCLTSYTARSYTVTVEKDKTTYTGTNKSIGGTVDKGIIHADLHLNFPGLWLKNIEPGFSFLKTDLGSNPLQGAEFLLIDREDLISILNFMVNLGKANFTSVINNIQDPEKFNFQEVLELQKNLISFDANGQLQIDAVSAYKLIKTLAILLGDVDVMEEFKAAGCKIPAILEATSNENGVVTFDRTKNISLVWMIPVLQEIAAAGADNVTNEDYKKILEFVSTLLDATGGIASSVINSVVYPFVQRMGLVGDKMPTGHYFMFEHEAPSGYFRSPVVYTVNVTWSDDDWVYANIADLGIIAPYFAEGLYTFVRNTTVSGTVDKIINSVSGKEVNLIDRILSDDIDVTASVIAFTAEIIYNNLGGNAIYGSVNECAAALSKFLYSNGRTSQNLIIFAVNTAKKTKAFFTGDLTTDWQFYNVSKALFGNSQAVITYTINNLKNAIVIGPKVPGQFETPDETVSQNVSTQTAAKKTTIKKINLAKVVNKLLGMNPLR